VRQNVSCRSIKPQHVNKYHAHVGSEIGCFKEDTYPSIPFQSLTHLISGLRPLRDDINRRGPFELLDRCHKVKITCLHLVLGLAGRYTHIYSTTNRSSTVTTYCGSVQEKTRTLHIIRATHAQHVNFSLELAGAVRSWSCRTSTSINTVTKLL
jgi:hypothetical protein